MFDIGEVVFHKRLGLCTIKENTVINDLDYYVLNSNNDESKIMIPEKNANILIRKISSIDEIEKLKETISKFKIEVIHDFKTRIRYYDGLLKTGEIEQLAKLIKNIYEQKQESN